MKRALTAAIVMAAIAGASAPAMAKGPKDCPPGLAKKSPACIPPGQAKKHYHYHAIDDDEYDGRYHRGRHLPDWYDRVEDPRDYGLEVIVNGSDYYIHDGVIYRVSTETREVLELFRAVDSVLN